MKQTLSILLFLSIVFRAYSQNAPKRYEIIGYIKGIGTNNKVYLGNKGQAYNSATKLVFYDSCFSKNDSFYFAGNISQPDIYSIEIPKVKESWLHFVLESSKIFITDTSGKLYTSKIIGSTQDSIYRKYINDVEKTFSPIIRFWMEQLDSESNTANNMYYDYYLVKRNFKTLEFIREHPGDFASLYELNDLVRQIGMDTARKYYNLLNANLQNHTLGKELYYDLFQKNDVIQINKTIPFFPLQDTSGKKIPVST